MLSARIAVLLLAGCGRIDFDARDDARGGGDDDGVGDGRSADAIPSCANWSAWSAPQRIVELSTADNDWEPTLSTDMQTLVYTQQNAMNINLIVATRQGAVWVPTPITALNSGDAYGAEWNAAGTRLYFGSTRTADTKMLYVSTYNGGAFGAPSLVAGLQGVVSITSPAVSTDELEMFYTQDTDSANANIGRATRASITDAWDDQGTVAELDPSNVCGWASLSSDGLSIYLENDATMDTIELATRASRTSPFTTPVPVSELNTVGDNGDPEISRDGTTMIFASDRAGGAGMADLYTSTRTCL